MISRNRKLAPWGVALALTIVASAAWADHPRRLVGTWDIDREILVGSAGAVAEAMGHPEHVERYRDGMRSMVIRLKLKPDGSYFFKAKAPRIKTASKGTWELSGLDIELTRKRGSRIIPRATIFKGKDGPRIRLRHPGMKGMKMVLVRTSGPLECNTTLSAYTKEAQGIIQGMLLDAASEFIYTNLVESLQHSNAFVNKLLKHRSAKRMVKVLMRKKIRGPFLSKLRQAFNMLSKKHVEGPAIGALRDITSNITKALSIMQVLEAASDGAYVEAATIAAVEAIGAYSTGAGVLLAVGRAAKADWDAFSRRVDKKFYRQWYEEFYLTSGHRPDPKKSRARARERLRIFMNDVLDVLSAGGLTGASRWAMPGIKPARLRRSLQIYANKKLRMNLSRKDFQLAPNSDPPRFKSKAMKGVLANLFWSFEKTFERDVQAELLRLAMVEQNKFNKDAVTEAKWAVGSAANGRFDKVWGSEAAYKNAFCAVAQEASEQLKGKGLLKP